MFPEETYAVNFFKLHDITVALNSFKTELFQVSHQTPVYQKIKILVFFQTNIPDRCTLTQHYINSILSMQFVHFQIE